MNVYRFIFKAYPTENHPELHPWQRATLVLFVGNSESHMAEEEAFKELNRRYWVPESFEHKDILIRDVVA